MTPFQSAMTRNVATCAQATGVEECTFEPDLPVASQQIASYSTDGDVYERLSSCKDIIIKSFLVISFPFCILIDAHENAVEAKQQLKREMQEKKKDMEVEGCTFTPDVCSSVSRTDASTPSIHFVLACAHRAAEQQCKNPKWKSTKFFC